MDDSNHYILDVHLLHLFLEFSHLCFLSQMELPKWVIRWLKNVPVAVMAALLAQDLLLSENEISISANILKLLAAIPAFAIAIFTKSLLGTVVVGVIFMMILRFIF